MVSGGMVPGTAECFRRRRNGSGDDEVGTGRQEEHPNSKFRSSTTKKMFEPRKCKHINCTHISYSKTVFYDHSKSCTIMSYTEHPGFEHMNAIIAKRSKKFAVAYYQPLNAEKRADLQSCIAQLHGELESKRKAFEELEKIADKIDDLMKGPNQLTRGISSDSEYESPRDRRSKKRSAAQAMTQASAPVAAGWLPFSFGGARASTAAPLSLVNPTSTQARV